MSDDEKRIKFCGACSAEVPWRATQCGACGAELWPPEQSPAKHAVGEGRGSASRTARAPAPTRVPVASSPVPVHPAAAGLRGQLNLIALLLGGILVLLLVRTFAPSAVARAARWEYKIEAYQDSSWSMTTMGANADGKDGWEIIAARRATGGYSTKYECVLKRPR